MPPAFEHYDKNTLGNLKMLAETGEVVGDTKRGLGDYGKLNGDKLGYKIPFPLAMDEVTERNEPVKEENILEFIRMQVPDFDAHT